jgi:hypothetical protein
MFSFSNSIKLDRNTVDTAHSVSTPLRQPLLPPPNPQIFWVTALLRTCYRTGRNTPASLLMQGVTRLMFFQ